MSVTVGRIVGAYKDRVIENAKKNSESDRALKMTKTIREVYLLGLLLEIGFF